MPSRKEDTMVSYSDLFQLGLLIVAIIGLTYKMKSSRKKDSLLDFALAVICPMTQATRPHDDLIAKKINRLSLEN